jgi:hypothetical protein
MRARACAAMRERQPKDSSIAYHLIQEFLLRFARSALSSDEAGATDYQGKEIATRGRSVCAPRLLVCCNPLSWSRSQGRADVQAGRPRSGGLQGVVCDARTEKWL